MNKRKKKFSWRAFISMGLFYSLIIIFLTGIVLYLAPSGQVAHWVARNNDKDIEQIMQILKENNITAKKDQTFRHIAAENDIPTRDVFELIE